MNPYTTTFLNGLSDEDANAAQASALVFASANSLHLDEYNSFRLPMIEYTNKIKKSGHLPAIILGIGVQKTFDQKTNHSNIKLFDFQQDFMRTIARRQTRPALTVRGEMTAAACRNSGIDNCLAMGCPSLTISTLPDLGDVLEHKWQKVLSKIASASSASEKKNIKIAFGPPAGLPKDSGMQMLHVFRKIAQDYDCTLIAQGKKDDAIFEKLGFNYTRFTKIEDWFQMLSEVDLVISARIHGGMTGVAVATPTVIIPTDFRIQELAYLGMCEHFYLVTKLQDRIIPIKIKR
jgi:hypothetical protein